MFTKEIIVFFYTLTFIKYNKSSCLFLILIFILFKQLAPSVTVLKFLFYVWTTNPKVFWKNK